MTEVKLEPEFWSPLSDRKVECRLCFRHCELAEGQDGFCKGRGNRGGRMALLEYGELHAASLIMLGYKDQYRHYYPGALALMVGGFRCSSRCAFCINRGVRDHHEQLESHPTPETPTIFRGGRTRVPPEQVVACAKGMRASHIVFAGNEAMVGWEHVYDVATLARRVGIKVFILTNGLSEVEPIRRLAPLVDAIHLGVKGSLNPGFYSRAMHAPGGDEAVRRSAAEWKRLGVWIVVSNLVAPPRMLSDDGQEESDRAFYPWVAGTLGANTPVEITRMLHPDHPERFLIVPGEEDAYQARCERTEQLAVEAGLLYTHAGLKYVLPGSEFAFDEILCQACGGTLLKFREPVRPCQPCTMEQSYCAKRTHEQHVTNGRCDRCRARVPVRTLTAAQLAVNGMIVEKLGQLSRTGGNR